MAKFETIIPFILHFAAGVAPDKLSLPHAVQFEIARSKGWSDDPDDPGGATMIDVTLSTYRAYRKTKGFRSTTKQNLRNISFNEWRDILKDNFWDLWKADKIESQGIANILVDWIWASGPKAIRYAQKIIGVKADGIVGPLTLSAINNSNQEELFKKIRISRELHYRQCKGAWKYLNGWLRRLNAICPDGTFAIRCGSNP
ncbi:MAG: peptidoglycan domain protein [Bacteroides sp.]|nr:peptidoglycan domain protein [Bacteroides sp.]